MTLRSIFPGASDDVLRLNSHLEGVTGPGTQNKGTGSHPSKFHNAKTEVRGLLFDSGHEAAVIGALIVAEEAKKIFALRLQVRFPLQGGVVYVADACYLDDKLQSHIVDAKGYRTREYKNKAKQFKAQYGREIEEL